MRRDARYHPFWADVGARNAVTMKKIDKAQQANEFRRGIAEKLTVAEKPSKIRDLSKVLGSTLLAGATRTIDAEAPNMRGTVLDFLNQIGDIKLAAIT